MQDQSTPSLTTEAPASPSALIENLNNQSVSIESWFRQQWQDAKPPLYGSVDIRNAGFKLAPVDTNLFPAGFNNLNLDYMPLYVQAMQACIAETCPDITRLLLIPESHTRNTFYFESIGVLHSILSQAGFDVRLGSLSPELKSPQIHQLASGKSLTIEPLIRENDQIGVKDFFPCMIILNNDLSDGIPPLLQDSKQIILPSTELGWTNRLKSEHFRYYQHVCESFSQSMELDPWLISPYFDQCPEVDFKQSIGQDCLVSRAGLLLARIKQKYAEYQIEHQPFLVIKADQGTYGMAVMMIDQPEQIRELNRKQRNKMSMTKGGKQVSKVIIQEGVHTFENVGTPPSIAEPVIYLIGRHVVGGFYRVHQNRGSRENLNAPGMDFQPLAFKQPCHLTQNVTLDQRFYAYGVIARLAQLAAAKELQTLSQTSCEDNE